MKTLLTILLFICLSSVSFSQTYYPEWRYFPAITLAGSNATATLDLKYVGGEIEFTSWCMGGADVPSDTAGNFTVKNITRRINSSTVFDTADVFGERLDTILTLRLGTFLHPIVTHGVGRPVHRLIGNSFDKVVFTKDALANSTITIYARQRVLVRKP